MKSTRKFRFKLFWGIVWKRRTMKFKVYKFSHKAIRVAVGNYEVWVFSKV